MAKKKKSSNILINLKIENNGSKWNLKVIKFESLSLNVRYWNSLWDMLCRESKSVTVRYDEISDL